MPDTRKTLVNKWSEVDQVTTDNKNDIKVIITYSSNTYSSNKTLTEIQSALSSGGHVRFISDLGSEGELVANVSGSNVSFFCIDNSGTSLVICIYTITSSGVTKVTKDAYIKPSGGIPLNDMASSVQSLLTAAGTALQPYLVEFTFTGSGFSCNKTFSEIFSANQSGKLVKGELEGYLGDITYITNSVALFGMLNWVSPSSSPEIYLFGIDSNNAVISTNYAVGNAFNPSVVINSSATPSSLSAQDNKIYNYTASALTSLTISSIPAAGTFVIKFVSGSTATSLTVPSTMKMPDGFVSPEANKRYEINVSDGYALVSSWAVSA